MPSMDREDLDEANRQGGVNKTFNAELQPYADAAHKVLDTTPFEPFDRMIFDMWLSAYTKGMMVMALVDAGYWSHLSGQEEGGGARVELANRWLFIIDELRRQGITIKTT